MPIEQFQCAVTISDMDDYTEDEVLRVYNYLMTSHSVDRKKFQHLGSRSGLNPNIELFMNLYPEEKWDQLVENAYANGLNNAKKKINEKLKKQLAMLKAELLKSSGAQKATSNFYQSVKNEGKEEENVLIYKCFLKPKLVLDSVCYVRMIHE